MLEDEVRGLIALANAAAAATPDRPAVVATAITTAIVEAADPWLLIGVLVEGIAETINRSIPAARRQECAAAIIALLVERYRSAAVGGSDLG